MIIYAERIKEHNIDNVSWFGMLIFHTLKDSGFSAKWDKGNIVTDALEADLDEVYVDMNFADGRKRTIKELCLKY